MKKFRRVQKLILIALVGKDFEKATIATVLSVCKRRGRAMQFRGMTSYWCSLNYVAPACGAWPLCVKNAADFAFLSFYSSFSEASA